MNPRVGLAMIALLVPAHGAAAQLLAPSAGTLLVQHRVDVGSGVETSAGPIWTAGAHATVRGRFLANLDIASGTLAGRDGVADRDMAELRVGAGYRVASWIALEAGYMARSFGTALALQRWTGPFVTATTRVAFATRGLAAIGRLTLLPSVSVSELPSPGLAVAIGTGLEGTAGRFKLGLLYELERHTFAPQAGATREEQLATLALRVQWGSRP